MPVLKTRQPSHAAQSRAVLGALSIIGTRNGDFTIRDSAVVCTTFLPLGWFGGASIGGDATVAGDVECNVDVTNGLHYGLVDGTARTPAPEVTTAPPYAWQP